MNTIDRLMSSLENDASVSLSQILVGTFGTAVVLDTDPPRCGLASALRSEETGPWPPVVDAGRLLDRSGWELATMLYSERILEASMGMATYNALLEVDTGPLNEMNAADLVLEQGTGKRIAIVGHFPFIERARGGKRVAGSRAATWSG